jgi:hypothetical protein
VLTSAGYRQLGMETEHWARLSTAVDRILALTPRPAS